MNPTVLVTLVLMGAVFSFLLWRTYRTRPERSTQEQYEAAMWQQTEDNS